MHVGRALGLTATTLPNGKALIVGGLQGTDLAFGEPTATAELFG
jgi:hypothetical protein